MNENIQEYYDNMKIKIYCMNISEKINTERLRQLILLNSCSILGSLKTNLLDFSIKEENTNIFNITSRKESLNIIKTSLVLLNQIKVEFK